MNCESIDELFAAYLDNEVTPGERTRVDKHLSACDKCREELQFLGETQQSLRHVLKSTAEAIEPSPQAWNSLRDRIAAAGSFWGRLSEFLNSPGLRMALPVAVMVLLATGLIWNAGIFSSPKAVPAPSPVTQAPMTPTTPPAATPPITTSPSMPSPIPAPGVSPAATPPPVVAVPPPVVNTPPPPAPTVLPPLSPLPTEPSTTPAPTTPPPVVNVAPGQVTVQPPNITVNPPQVTVAAPPPANVVVQAPSVVVTPPPPANVQVNVPQQALLIPGFQTYALLIPVILTIGLIMAMFWPKRKR